MTRKAFSFKKSYEEVELAGKVFKIEFTDDDLLRYQKKFDHFYVEAKRLNEIDTSGMDVAEQEETFNEMIALTKSLVEELLGKGSFEFLYEASGKSMFNMLDAIEYLSEIVGDKLERTQRERKEKYLVKKKR